MHSGPALPAPNEPHSTGGPRLVSGQCVVTPTLYLDSATTAEVERWRAFKVSA